MQDHRGVFAAIEAEGKPLNAAVMRHEQQGCVRLDTVLLNRHTRRSNDSTRRTYIGLLSGR